MDQAFVRELLKIGIVSYDQQESLFQIAKRCARTTGIPMAGAGGLIGMSAGTIIVPGVGSIPGYLAGALAGLVSGTVSCSMLNAASRKQLKVLAEGL